MTRLVESLETPLRLPDLWQQRAIRALQAGRDVVVDAPTGAGKTYIFEMLVESGLRTDAIYTVPTRALANDKRQEWRENHWNVGIVTGDLAENTDAPVIVATLETQKHRFLAGKGPGLLVVDEYQMLGDQSRGVNYELALALAPSSTQLLLLSGSVANPGMVAAWLRRLGRQVELIQHTERPVPLEEVRVEALPDRGIPATVKGFWPRAIAKALAAGMAPLLTFAPRRKSAEALAVQIARMLPEEDPLVLTPEQQRLAGDSLTRLLRARVAYHHSGLDYRQRAGLIEPLAKAGQLRVVVATMGLSSGINFSMRSVLVTDREYRSGEGTHLVRPDELLQMFGRAGRRGLDKKGYVLVAPGKPRVSESRPLSLRRSAQIDWPSLIAVMQAAVERAEDPMEAARALSARLFSLQRIPLGLDQFHRKGPRPAAAVTFPTRTQTIVEFQRPDGEWERQRSPRRTSLGDALWFENDAWLPALARPAILGGVSAGTLCHLGEHGGHRLYGREVPLARIGRDDSEGELVLTRWTAHALRSLQTNGSKKTPVQRKHWTLHALETRFVHHLPQLTHGGAFAGMDERNDTLYARLDYRLAETFAYVDSTGQALINPPTRSVDVEVNLHFAVAPQTPERLRAHTPADAWFDLGLMDEQARPTLRGRLFSFFNHGEGLALAAALEDTAYPLDELVFDIANLRAGHRFSEHETFSSRLGNLCRTTFRNATFPGYLRKGVPEDYGDGAAEILLHLADKPAARRHILNEDLSSGDVERARLEWRSLLNHIAHAPDLDWERWLDFRRLCRETLYGLVPPAHFGEFPPLTPIQRKRHRSFLRFD